MSSSTQVWLHHSLPKPFSRVSVLGKSRRDVFAKDSIEMAESNSTPSVFVNSSKQNGSIIVIDNYDSFAYNLCHIFFNFLFCFGQGCRFEVYRNYELTVEELKNKNPRVMLISPGPGTPQDSGIFFQTVLKLGPRVSLFGVCMNLQCIGEAFGGYVLTWFYSLYYERLCGHYLVLCIGKAQWFTMMRKENNACSLDYPSINQICLYHSLVIEKDSFPSGELEVTAWTADGLVMASCHMKYRHIQGVQFHPESIITTEGKTIVCNFIKLVEKKESEKLT
ncbi:hypothetical protein ARALYDRAFT_484723 [Arabidopsis lyrata subsp. lyrata]|uniref:anthranilate synthase n=1 Tax=Arabidopsis lyrata subsp. lyrata TaxID=81972 RepID=D7LP35_ARALL|nr:hypothetical protein ARALYDRAFT_484723 [Arabidopsis lyrata subsp. lyrata]